MKKVNRNHPIREIPYLDADHFLRDVSVTCLLQHVDHWSGTFCYHIPPEVDFTIGEKQPDGGYVNHFLKKISGPLPANKKLMCKRSQEFIVTDNPEKKDEIIGEYFGCCSKS